MYFEYLPEQDQLNGFSEYLQTIQEKKALYYEMGQTHNLNMLDISVQTVHSILHKGILFEELPETIPKMELILLDIELSDLDMNLINSLEWFGFEENQIGFLLDYSNMLMRRYLSRFFLILVQGKIHCVKMILERFSIEEQHDLLDQSTEQAHFQALVQCFQYWNEWTRINKNRPKEMISLDLSCISWLDQIKEITTQATESMMELVQTTTMSEPLDHYLHYREYEIIRAMYVPTLLFWIYEMNFQIHHYYPENLQICFDLAELIANDVHFDIYQSFIVSNQLHVFLDYMQNAAMASLEVKQIPWSSKK